MRWGYKKHFHIALGGAFTDPKVSYLGEGYCSMLHGACGAPPCKKRGSKAWQESCLLCSWLSLSHNSCSLAASIDLALAASAAALCTDLGTGAEYSPAAAGIRGQFLPILSGTSVQTSCRCSKEDGFARFLPEPLLTPAVHSDAS